MDRCGGCAAVIIIEFPTENIIFPECSILKKSPSRVHISNLYTIANGDIFGQFLILNFDIDLLAEMCCGKKKKNE